MANAVVEEARNLFSGEVNLSATERAVSVAGGLALAALGAKPRPNMFLSLAALLGGAALAIRGATGHCPYKALTQPDDHRRLEYEI